MRGLGHAQGLDGRLVRPVQTMFAADEGARGVRRDEGAAAVIFRKTALEKMKTGLCGGVVPRGG